MTEEEKQKLNEELTIWSDAKEYFTDEDGCQRRKVVLFTDSLDACFKWLVPKVSETREVIITIPPVLKHRERYIVEIAFGIKLEAETLSLALCLAIEKLIDEKP